MPNVDDSPVNPAFCSSLSVMKEAGRILDVSEKQDIISEIVSSLAHEINNPLQALTNLLFLARTERDEACIQAFLSSAECQVRRAGLAAYEVLKVYRGEPRDPLKAREMAKTSTPQSDPANVASGVMSA